MTNSNLPVKHFVFDFDGVLAESGQLMYQALNYGLQYYKIPVIPLSEFEEKSKYELIKEKDINWFKTFLVIRQAKKYMASNIERIKKIKPILSLLEKHQISAFIISSNSVKNIKKILGEDAKLFTEIYGDCGLFGKEKYLKKFRVSSLYFTDEVRDIVQCQKVKLPVVAVSWGLDSAKKLKESNPLDILNEYSEIEKYLKKPS